LNPSHLRASLQDVAREAGVSLATVDRVLHGRPGVHTHTIARVNEVVQRIGFRPDPAAARLARGRRYSLCFVLPAGSNSFVGLLADQVQALAGWLSEQRARAVVETVDRFAPEALARHLDGLRGKHDAVIVMALDHPLVRVAIDDLVEGGTEVLTLVSDVPASRRARFVGIDNVAAGRTAATLLGRFCGPGACGPVALVLGSLALRDHAERLFGFHQVLATEHPGLQALPAIEGQDRSDLTEPLLRELLAREPGLVAIYSAGAGNRGIQAALADHPRGRQIVWVCHELTAEAKRALLKGTADAVIHQDPGHEVRSACRLALAALSGEPVLAEQERIGIDIYVKDNLP
jgi:LacI family transcriptional regulator